MKVARRRDRRRRRVAPISREHLQPLQRAAGRLVHDGLTVWCPKRGVGRRAVRFEKCQPDRRSSAEIVDPEIGVDNEGETFAFGRDARMARMYDRRAAEGAEFTSIVIEPGG